MRAYVGLLCMYLSPVLKIIQSCSCMFGRIFPENVLVYVVVVSSTLEIFFFDSVLWNVVEWWSAGTVYTISIHIWMVTYGPSSTCEVFTRAFAALRVNVRVEHQKELHFVHMSAIAWIKKLHHFASIIHTYRYNIGNFAPSSMALGSSDFASARWHELNFIHIVIGRLGQNRAALDVC